jgi:hypothetical protein
MSAYLRRAGAGLLPDGSQLVWSVADGRRGRRWRAMASSNGAITHALLLEVDTEGRPSRLELTTPAGMLTLHPDQAGRVLHGNVVTSAGVRHLSLPWSDAHGLEVEGRPIASAVTAHQLARAMAEGEGRAVPVVVVAADLVVSKASRRYVRVGHGEWRIEPASGHGAATILRIDERGIPSAPGDTQEWPLEVD